MAQPEDTRKPEDQPAERPRRLEDEKPRKPAEFVAGQRGLAALQALADYPGPLGQMASLIAHRVNTGMGGHEARKAVAQLEGAAALRLVEEAAQAKVGEATAAEWLHLRFPERPAR